MFSFCLSSFFVCVCQPFYRLAYGCQDLFFNFPQFSDTQRLSSQHADQIFCPVPFHKEACFQSLVRLLIKAFQNITFTKYCFPHLFQCFVPFPFSVNCFSGFDIHLGYSCVLLCCAQYSRNRKTPSTFFTRLRGYFEYRRINASATLGSSCSAANKCASFKFRFNNVCSASCSHLNGQRYFCFFLKGFPHRDINLVFFLSKHTLTNHSPRAAPLSLVNLLTIGETKTQVSGLYNLFPSNNKSLSS